MLYLLDANVLITAHRFYYPVDVVPEFWDWLAHQGEAGNIKMPIETFEEVKGGGKKDHDLLSIWTQDDAHKAAILFDEKARPQSVQQVTKAYATDLTDDELEAIGQDPFLISYALADTDHRCIVTTEVSKPKAQRQNRRIPDICTDVGVRCCDPFKMLRELHFRTSWRT